LLERKSWSIFFAGAAKLADTKACKTSAPDQLLQIIQTGRRLHGINYVEFTSKASIGEVMY